MLELPIAFHSRRVNHCCPRYGAEAGLWSSGAQLVQPVDAKEHDGRTHAAVLEAVNRDGFAEHDPNPVYSAQFQSTSQHGTIDAGCESVDGACTDAPQVDDTSITKAVLRETGHDDSASTLNELALPAPIPRDTASLTTSTTADDEGVQVSRTFSTPPPKSRHGARDGDGGSAVLPAASSPLFEPQAALLHTVRASRPPRAHTHLLHTHAPPARLLPVFTLACSLLPPGCVSDAGSSRRGTRNPGCQLHAAAPMWPATAAGPVYAKQKKRPARRTTKSFSLDAQVSVRRYSH